MNIIEENDKFELYTDNFDEFSFEELKVELEEILNIPVITAYHLQHETMGPRIVEAYRKLTSEISSNDRYIKIIMGFAISPFRVFESYLRIEVCLGENDIHLILKQNISNFVTYN